ncbi:MAG: SIS domain-containing protein [Myxococcota bacterium]|jgi:glucosamine 6-phosphate synthetase-like amidotransferase/phosphosugar isomerase protein|nr:SIS domain-containing protein [Myxococcota bacterium]
MCGVVGLIYEKQKADLGRVAAELLKTLEYRGYDSTGAAFQAEGEEVRLVKGVGAPSVMVHTLGISEARGQIFCGQVRWATFGAVDEVNSQPHVVRCKEPIYGAHNGNVTNCDDLRAWLTDEGHRVLSDNDGEMVVHTVEHGFARELAALAPGERRQAAARRRCMRAAWLWAASRLAGSYAAVVADPVSRTLWAVKQGSSLYFGIGRDEAGEGFGVASSDLSSVLKLTRVVVPLHEGELVEYDGTGHQLYSLADGRTADGQGERPVKAGEPLSRQPVRSRLRAKDMALIPPFETFMDQEISAQEETCRNVIRLFTGGSEAARILGPFLRARPEEEIARISAQLDQLRDEYQDERIRQGFHLLVDLPESQALLASLPDAVKDDGTDAPPELLADRLASAEAGFFADLLRMGRSREDLVFVRLVDVLRESEEVAEFSRATRRFGEAFLRSQQQGGRQLVVCCGSSYNAARAAALFFNELARCELVPLLPGEFRERVSRTLRDGDLIVAVSQSGETKDLIDILNDTLASGRRLTRVAVVNNVNSTLAEEKADLVIPLRCGPEIAVPATKSFMNQLTVFFCLALELGETRCRELPAGDPGRQAWEEELRLRRAHLGLLPQLIRETFDSTAAEVEEAAQLLYLRPSIHLLAMRLTALAREGALKIREVVLNHAEGFEGSEFKHGPNTILGFNTVLGPPQLERLLQEVGRQIDTLLRRASDQGLPPASLRRLARAVTDSVFSASSPFSLTPEEQPLFAASLCRDELFDALYADYPLIYLTGPDERDVHLAVSQINTHKIRGACTVLIAEESPALRGAVSKAPADNPDYRWVYLPLPRTDDTLLVVFSATVVLQRLALKMSLAKAAYLDRLGIKDHGVHPDVPKNVSKSITVD